MRSRNLIRRKTLDSKNLSLVKTSAALVTCIKTVSVTKLAVAQSQLTSMSVNYRKAEHTRKLRSLKRFTLAAIRLNANKRKWYDMEC